MPETLLTPSSIKMFGRVVTSLTYTNDTTAFALGNNNFLQRQLSAAAYAISVLGTTNVAPLNVVSAVTSVTPPGLGTAQLAVGMPVTGGGIPNGTTIIAPITSNSFTLSASVPAGAGQAGAQITATASVNFARIYAFSFEGAVYGLPKPAMFLVSGPGIAADMRADRLRTTTDTSGVVAREWELSAIDASGDLRYWEYEKGDFSIRLDTEAGPFEQILLGATLRGADMGDRSGANLGVRSGANLSGANLSGANLSGANLAGANLSGANLRGR